MTKKIDREPLQIRLETEHYRVRPVEPGDASEDVCAWLADPQTARMLNIPAGSLSTDDLRRYFATHDGVTTHILGVFDKDSGALRGFWGIYVDWEHREFLINTVTGRERAEGAGARNGGVGLALETIRPLLPMFFEEQDLLRMRGAVLARNNLVERHMENHGLKPEHVSHKQSAFGPDAEEIHHYSFERDAWRVARQARIERERAERERTIARAS
jgi:RimJ/RimL family protein N-acetyltransferase